MRIIGCDLHTAKQTIAMLDRDTGEVVEQTLNHDGEAVRAFYAAIPSRPWWASSPQARWLVRAIDGGAGSDVPRGPSGGDPDRRATAAET
jgi:hypothetical protein